MIQLGAHFVTPYQGDWNTQQRPRFRQMKAQIGKVMMPAGFRTEPSHVQDLIQDGAHTIILRTEDCGISYQKLRDDYIGRGFQEVVRRNPDVRFVIEVGNEPELCGSPEWPFNGIEHYINQAHDTGRNLHQLSEPNLEFILSMPTDYGNYLQVVDSGVLQYYDGIGTHVYGHFRLEDGGGGRWIDILNHALKKNLKVWLTEVGINDRNIGTTEKARRILNYVQNLSNRVQGVVVFTIGWNTHWPQYEVDDSMAQVFGGRDFNVGEFHHQTGKYISPLFLSYHRQHGGIRQFGYPISNQMTEDVGGVSRPVQYFERNVMEWHQENPPEWQVLLRLLGVEEFKRRYR